MRALAICNFQTQIFPQKFPNSLNLQLLKSKIQEYPSIEIYRVLVFGFFSRDRFLSAIFTSSQTQVVAELSICPRQKNVMDSGCYVMRYMKEIIDHKQTRICEDYFHDCNILNYDQGQIDEVRAQWTRYVLLV
ncbi:uncharacterized protein [Spinacia oleracea]|uniref:Uncharacterized protein n=1 Tax=Spinacia oleracea TaxID=3562 RepID=A0ABM3QGR0_SPIOL|nr:uncharacterized protein LOC110779828 [Spinacia oleracea]